ncbi:phosphotransferase [Kribbella sp. GL6]|uniref:phosphotransferase n=1 Tax=Kribbella sp. GL6 TaxID=3419765 RepID=UPI003D0409A9
MEPSEVTRAIATATSIATSLGLRADNGTVLHNSNKLAVRLTPCDAFARVAPVGEEVAEFEIELAQRLAEVGSPVAALDPRVEPRVYVRDGFAVTFWTYYEPAADLSPAEYADALARLHAGMRKVDLPSTRFTDRIDAAQAIVSDPAVSPDLPDVERSFLSARLESLRQAVENHDEQLLHGEPHPGNLLSTREGPLFIDFETCCRGPIEFDLAHVPEAVCDHYPNLNEDLLATCRELVLALVTAWRWDRADQFPHGREFGEEFLRALHTGPPWPTLDAMAKRVP